MSYGCIANLCAFQQCKNFENRLRFDKITEFKGGNFFESQCILAMLSGGACQVASTYFDTTVNLPMFVQH